LACNLNRGPGTDLTAWDKSARPTTETDRPARLWPAQCWAQSRGAKKASLVAPKQPRIAAGTRLRNVAVANRASTTQSAAMSGYSGLVLFNKIRHRGANAFYDSIPGACFILAKQPASRIPWAIVAIEEPAPARIETTQLNLLPIGVHKRDWSV